MGWQATVKALVDEGLRQSEAHAATERWFTTPKGPMRQLGVAPGPVPAHWYWDRDGRSRAFPDSLCKPTRTPRGVKLEALGEELLAKRRAGKGRK